MRVVRDKQQIHLNVNHKQEIHIESHRVNKIHKSFYDLFQLICTDIQLKHMN